MSQNMLWNIILYQTLSRAGFDQGLSTYIKDGPFPGNYVTLALGPTHHHHDNKNCNISALLRVRANPRPLLPTDMGGSEE